MHIKTRSVNTAFRQLVSGIHTGEIPTVKEPSRNGVVLRVDEPVLLTYEKPQERVLFNSARDANPFFHVMESLWMLAGRNDVTPLAYYASRMKDFSDDGKTLNGAYGYRWRHSRPVTYPPHPTAYNTVVKTDVDQLDTLVNHLKACPESRRAVLQMWDVEDDLLKIGTGRFVTCPACKGDIGGAVVDAVFHLKVCPVCKAGGEVPDGSRDVCCNLSVMFSLREEPAMAVVNSWMGSGHAVSPVSLTSVKVLDMTVTNRSNDMIWGMLGANYVHFTFLQEYMAARLGVEVGRYHHFTNNLHVYDWNWKPEEWLEYYGRQDGSHIEYSSSCQIVPLVKNPAKFEQELPLFVGAFNGEEEPWSCVPHWEEPFFQDVAAPALSAFRRHRQGRTQEAMEFVEQIESDDWRVACREWIQRRIDKRAKV